MSLNSFPADPRIKFIQELKRDSEPKEQMRFEFVDDNTLLLQDLQMNLDDFGGLGQLVDFFSDNEKRLLKSMKSEAISLMKQKKSI
jgi:hypothetical protein